MAEEKRTCNRCMSIGDDHGDNSATLRCRLPMGHDGPHQETYEDDIHGKVTVSFEKGFAPVRLERVKHMIPEGRTCQFEDGRNCPFLALHGMDGERKRLACYLSGDIWGGGSRFYPNEFSKGCD
ncbi:MAG: hypothetical protein M1492_08685 [Gammaproteobacteria bacterium]|uniref:hypothetical protein n=1 Tax=Acidithiobacillus ferrooxidans TaxID=920 RepID=UPI0021497072|nr:hypothetical protein [Acidithiobacillus ferrooxidans]MCL4526527.1 hypothetical protein [Gammaproteobacteria bacterium]MCR1347069.1 hypothetical protein [Acidithiobacillus ferrooxidans]MCR1355867.1 hypothetical protein [Acidithiobacillus ferrooxidans]MDA8376732.1 hypothetical protein [Planctomycetia bacterium]